MLANPRPTFETECKPGPGSFLEIDAAKPVDKLDLRGKAVLTESMTCRRPIVNSQAGLLEIVSAPLRIVSIVHVSIGSQYAIYLGDN